MDTPTLQPAQTNKPSKTPKVSKDQQTTEADKPVTVMLPEGLLRKVKVLGAISGESLSEMVAQALTARVRKDLAAALSSLQE